MRIDVRLHGILRDRLAREARGRAAVDLPDGATLADLLAEFDLSGDVTVFVNGEVVSEPGRALREGDQVQMFRAIGGG